VKRGLAWALCLAAVLLVDPAGASDATPGPIDFAAGFQGRTEPTFARDDVAALFASSPALAAPSFAPVEPAFARPEAHELFATRADALSGETLDTPAEAAAVEPAFARPEIAALFASAAANPAPDAQVAAPAPEGPVFTRPDVSELFAAAPEPLADEEPEQRQPVFARAEVAALFEPSQESFGGGDDEAESGPAEPVFARPEVAALVEALSAAHAEEQPGVAERVFARAEVVGLFLERVDELAADLPDAPSPKAAPAIASRGQAPSSDGGPSMTGSLSSEAGPPGGVAAQPRDATTTASLPAPKRIGAGRAVWYDLPGRTANGEQFDPNAMTAGHRTLPFGTRVRVVNPQTGRSVVVRINDRGPVQRKFEIDLSRGSARAIGVTGVSTVELYAAD
jgi:rare lipoprotein A